MIERALRVIAVAGVCLLPVGCATRSFVHQEVQSIADLIKELNKEQRKVQQQNFQVFLQEQEVVIQKKVETALREEHERVGKAVSLAEAAAETADKALAAVEAPDSRVNRFWANQPTRKLVEKVVIAFGYKKWELDDRGQKALLVVVEALKGNPNLSVDLEGYTDPTGPVPLNVELSQRRAEAVRRFLVEKEIELPRIQAIGLGTANPIGDNKTREGRSKNRRVDVKLFTADESPDADALRGASAPAVIAPMSAPPPGDEAAEGHKEGQEPQPQSGSPDQDPKQSLRRP